MVPMVYKLASLDSTEVYNLMKKQLCTDLTIAEITNNLKNGNSYGVKVEGKLVIAVLMSNIKALDTLRIVKVLGNEELLIPLLYTLHKEHNVKILYDKSISDSPYKGVSFDSTYSIVTGVSDTIDEIEYINTVRGKFSPEFLTIYDRLLKYDIVEDSAPIKPSIVRSLLEGATFHYHDIVSFPLFSEDYVKYLMSKTEDVTYNVNSEEPYKAQIPEAVVYDKIPSLYKQLRALFFCINEVVSPLLYSHGAEDLTSIQFAKYSPDTVCEGTWHADVSSDITMVVAMSDKHSGGGTMVNIPGVEDPVDIPQLPLGHALLFPGKHYLHQGKAVTEGVRDLLVFWSTYVKG